MRKPKTPRSPADLANCKRNALLRFTAPEWTLARAGWINTPYGSTSRHNKKLAFPRGVWTHPEHGGPHSLDVALIVGKPIDGDGLPFADAVSVVELRRQVAVEKQAAAETERATIRAEAQARREFMATERELAK